MHQREVRSTAELAPDYRFVQGQHIGLRATLDGEELRRSYSICSGLDDGEIRVAIRKVGGGKFRAGLMSVEGG